MLAFLSNSVTIMFGKKCVKGLTVTKSIKRFKFEGVWDEL